MMYKMMYMITDEMDGMTGQRRPIPFGREDTKHMEIGCMESLGQRI